MRPWWLLALVLPLVMPPTSSAYTCNASGCTWKTSYTEPSTLTNGQAIADLTGCTATYTVAVDGGTPGATKTFQIAASRPQGGQAVSRDFTDTTMVPNHTYTVSETIACTSTAGGTGSGSPPTTLLMNNAVTTPPPSGVTLQ